MNLDDIKISVIVPVYNTAKYLDKCVESLVNQTLKNIEIILVDDGSTETEVEQFATDGPNKTAELGSSINPSADQPWQGKSGLTRPEENILSSVTATIGLRKTRMKKPIK